MGDDGGGDALGPTGQGVHDAPVLSPSEQIDLVRSERMYRRLVEHLAHEVHIWNLVLDEAGAIRTWRLEYANPAALKSWGRRLEEVVGLTTNEIFPIGDATRQFMPIVEQVTREGRPYIWEERFPGTGQILQMATIPIQNGFISTGLDVSQQRAIESELEQARRMESIGELAGGIAHDFNNQLTAILGYAELVEGAVEGEALEALRHIQTSARRSADLTSQLLAFARKGPADFVPVDAEALIHEVVAMLERSITKDIVIRCCLEAPGSRVIGDASLLGNALLNVGLNARDAMPEHGALTFETRPVRLDAAACGAPGMPATAGDYLRIDISDTGTGMPDEVRARIFEPFFTTKETGTGMGLAGVLGTVQRHGGSIDVETAPGKGTRMRIHLPLTTEAVAASEDPARPQTTDDTPLRILMVDDERLLRELGERLLTRLGHSVISAQDGQDALEIYEREWRQIDLVILDIDMPRMNGIEAFRSMRAINPGIRALIASGYGADATPVGMFREGAVDFVQKPFGSRELMRAIDAARQARPGSTGAD